LEIVGERKKLSDAAGAKRKCEMKIEKQNGLFNLSTEMRSVEAKGKTRQRTCRGHPP